MKKVLLVVLVLLSACRLDAAGIKARVAEYIDAVENRMALQPLAATGNEAQTRFREWSTTEEALETELQAVFRCGDDIAEVAMGFLAEADMGDALLYFRSLIPTDTDSPAARRVLAKMKAIQKRRVEGQPTSAATTPDRGAEPVSAGPLGAALLARPDFRAPVTTLVPARARLTLTARSGTFALATDQTGRQGYVFLGLVDSAEEAPTIPEGTPAADDIVPDLAKFQKINDQKPTYYITTREEGFPTSGILFGHSYDGTERKSILTPAGAMIAETSGRFFADLCMEGSGVIKDGRTVSFVSNQRFSVAPDGCLGITCTGYWVVPFHTLAVNKNSMPYRGVYYVPGTRGLKLPNGETHDGYWFAHDTGSAFTGTTNRMDMYVNTTAYWKWMEANFVGSFTPVKVYKVDADTKARVYAKYQAVLGKP